MRASAADVQCCLEADLYNAGWLGPVDYPDLPFEQRAMTALCKSLFKKFHNDKTSDDRDNAALTLFLQCNEACKNFTEPLPLRLDEEYVIGEMKSIIYDFFNPKYLTGPEGEEVPFRQPFLLNLTDITNGMRLGNGSNIGSSADMYSKYVCSSMSYTDSRLPLFYSRSLVKAGLWGDVEAYRSSNLGFTQVSGSRLSFVPKSQKISRTICTEPLLNMFFQLGVEGILNGRLREVFGIDFSVQPERNVRLARLGSVTGEFGTIDLSSASDSISINLVRSLLPRQAFDLLMMMRSPKTILPDGREIELHMISSMGNGYTFPLQTMIFSALVKAAYKISGFQVRKPHERDDGNFAVFGDDIIVRAEVYNLVTRCLKVLGFVVNLDKSFNEGHFRESCGSDYYAGRNLRGVYLKRLLYEGDFYSAINRLNRWSAYHGVLLARTIGYLRKQCRFIGVPYDEADDAGIKIPLSAYRAIRRDANDAIKYMALRRVPSVLRIPSLEYSEQPRPSFVSKSRRKVRGFFYSSDGLMLCFVAGWLRSGCITLRSNRYVVVKKENVTPRWDYVTPPSGASCSYSETWKSFTISNLSLELAG